MPVQSQSLNNSFNNTQSFSAFIFRSQHRCTAVTLRHSKAAGVNLIPPAKVFCLFRFSAGSAKRAKEQQASCNTHLSGGQDYGC